MLRSPSIFIKLYLSVSEFLWPFRSRITETYDAGTSSILPLSSAYLAFSMSGKVIRVAIAAVVNRLGLNHMVGDICAKSFQRETVNDCVWS